MSDVQNRFDSDAFDGVSDAGRGGFVALAVIASRNLRDSRLGRAWRAMRDDEEVAACQGIPIARTKLLAYGTGAAFGGISGAFFASYLGVVDAAQFEFSFSIFIIAMVVLGGLGSVAGVVAGAIVLSALNNYLLRDALSGVDLSSISSGLFGAILVVVMLVRPLGLVPAGAQRAAASRAPRPMSAPPVIRSIHARTRGRRTTSRAL